MTSAAKRTARVPAGRIVESEKQQDAKPKSGRRENQGIAPDRRGQRAPVWPEAPGERAMRLLERLWGPR